MLRDTQHSNAKMEAVLSPLLAVPHSSTVQQCHYNSKQRIHTIQIAILQHGTENVKKDQQYSENARLLHKLEL